MSNFLYFDGESTFIEVGVLQSPSNHGGPITIEFWNYVQSADVRRSYPFSFQHSDAGQTLSRTSCHAPWSNGRIYWDFGEWDNGGRVELDDSPYLDKWTHVALVSSGTKENTERFQAIYLDGELAASQQMTSTPTQTFDHLLIGADYEDIASHHGVSFHHQGWMDHFRVWNYMRSPEQIRCNRYTRMLGSLGPDQPAPISEFGLATCFDLIYDGSIPSSLPNKVKDKPVANLNNFSSNGPQPPAGLPPAVVLQFTEIDDQVTVKLGDETIFSHDSILRKENDPICKDIASSLEQGENVLEVSLNNTVGSSTLRGLIATPDKTTQIEMRGTDTPKPGHTTTKSYTIVKDG